MGKYYLGAILILVVLAGSYLYIKNQGNLGIAGKVIGQNLIALESQEFPNGRSIPGVFTCDGDNINPPITIDRVPPDAKSLVLVMEDVDTKPPFTHWLLFNITSETMNIETGKLPNGAVSGKNDFGKIGYDGPCPPQGASHKYYFRIYALNENLAIEGNPDRKTVEDASKGHVIAKGEFYGEYLNRYYSR